MTDDQRDLHKPEAQDDQPEGYTPETPSAAELGEPGTPGAGLAPDAPHAADAAERDPHSHDDAALGPIDWGAWAYALAGVAAGVVIVALFWLASGGVR